MQTLNTSLFNPQDDISLYCRAAHTTNISPRSIRIVDYQIAFYCIIISTRPALYSGQRICARSFQQPMYIHCNILSGNSGTNSHNSRTTCYTGIRSYIQNYILINHGIILSQYHTACRISMVNVKCYSTIQVNCTIHSIPDIRLTPLLTTIYIDIYRSHYLHSSGRTRRRIRNSLNLTLHLYSIHHIQINGLARCVCHCYRSPGDSG